MSGWDLDIERVSSFPEGRRLCEREAGLNLTTYKVHNEWDDDNDIGPLPVIPLYCFPTSVNPVIPVFSIMGKGTE